MPIQYMGTKRVIIPSVLRLVDQLPKRPTRLVDLFAGTGSVAAAFAPHIPVTLNDALTFPKLLGKPRFLARKRGATERLQMRALRARADELMETRLSALGEEMALEEEAMAAGQERLSALIRNAQHTGNSALVQAEVEVRRTAGDYYLASLYFARGYFSTRQASLLDCLRQAIDEGLPVDDDDTVASPRDVALAAWLVAASRACNSPGHTAQFLAAGSDEGCRRVVAAWKRPVEKEFERALLALEPLGDANWRSRNRIISLEATAIPARVHSRWRGSLLYADPPYTKDHYSRFYHVLETLAAYDYPDSSGIGRTRSDRYLSAFSYKSQAADAFKKLGALVAQTGSPLLLSYPSNGLIGDEEVRRSLSSHGGVVQLVREVPHRHSSLGARHGQSSSTVLERLYLVDP